jgi:hypothetical protein
MLLGPADRDSIRKSKETIAKIMQILKKQNKINSDYKADFSKLERLINYSDICAVSLSHFEASIERANFNDLKNDIGKYGITERDMMSIYVSLILNQFLLMYAYLGNVLVSLLKGTKIGSQRIRGIETLGTLLAAIETVTAVKLKGTVIDEKFRNALGHGWYWVQNDQIHYYTDGTLKNELTLSIAELFIKQRKLWHFVATWGLIIYSS